MTVIPQAELLPTQSPHIARDYLKFAVGKEDHVLELSNERLHELKRFI